VFVDALRTDELRSAIEAAAAPILLATVCARRVVDRIGLPIAAMIWVEQASPARLDQIRRDYSDYDESADSGRRHPLYKEVEAYIATRDGRQTWSISTRQIDAHARRASAKAHGGSLVPPRRRTVIVRQLGRERG
jgi:hypothetical protein